MGDRPGKVRCHPRRIPNSEKGRVKIPALVSLGPTVKIYPLPSFQMWEDTDIEEFLFPRLPDVWSGGGATWIVSCRDFNCRIKQRKITEKNISRVGSNINIKD